MSEEEKEEMRASRRRIVETLILAAAMNRVDWNRSELTNDEEDLYQKLLTSRVDDNEETLVEMLRQRYEKHKNAFEPLMLAAALKRVNWNWNPDGLKDKKDIDLFNKLLASREDGIKENLVEELQQWYENQFKHLSAIELAFEGGSAGVRRRLQ